MGFTVAAVQFEPRFGEKEHNTAALLKWTLEAARAGARLVVLPELGTTGYCWSGRSEIGPLVEPVPDGPTVAAFARLAAAEAIYIVASLPEVEPATGAYYNTAVLLGPGGYLGKYRKTHSYIDETRWARDGDLGLPVFDTELGRIAMLICMDASYFEPARVTALAGADLVALPTNWLGNRTDWHARALENGIYMVCSNRWGEERGTKFCGNASVIGPDGVTLASLAAGDGLILAEVDLDAARQKRLAALARRRPDQYQDLLISTHLWHWTSARPQPQGRPISVAVAEGQDLTAMLAQLQAIAEPDLAVFPCCTVAPDPAPLAEMARSRGCYAVWGTVEPDGSHTAWLAGPSGEVTRCREARVEQGESLRVFPTPWGRLGLLTGPDLYVPETARILAKRGADIIAVPAAWESEPDRLLWWARAMENNTALAIANCFGGSRVLVPARPYLAASAPPAGIVAGTVDTGCEAIRAKELLRKLQPRWYDPLVAD